MSRPSRLSLLGCIALLAAMAPAVDAQGPIAPTEEHQALAREAGVWDASMKLWATPDQQEPMEMEGTETNTLMGPFWLISKFESQFAGNEFTGHAQLGYDPVSKQYVGTWVDTMTPYMATMEGSRDQEADTLTMVSTARDPQTGKMSTTTNVTKFIDEDTKKFTMYLGGPDDQNAWKMMEIHYTRAKEEAAQN